MSDTNRSPQHPDPDSAPDPGTREPDPPVPGPGRGPETPGTREPDPPVPAPSPGLQTPMPQTRISPTPGTREPHRPVPGPPNREGSSAAETTERAVHTPTAEEPEPPAGTPHTPTAEEPEPPVGARHSTSTPSPDTEEPALAPGPLGPSRRVSSAIRTVPNAVTLLRLLLVPVCAWLLATGRYGWGLVLTALVGSTDWVDGWLARRYGQVSRVGQLLDPLADRLLIASVAIALVVSGVVPWQAAVLLVARDLFLLAGWPLLKRRGIEPPEVVLLGKAATLVLLFALPVLTLGATGLAVAGAAHVLGLAGLWVGVAMYYLAGAVYVRMVLERLGQRTRAGS